MTRAQRAAFWLTPPLLCLALHWRGLFTWFNADDFAWLGLDLEVHRLHDLLSALFRPEAQGTLRPLSERAFFMAGYALFGLDALPFHIAAFAVHLANLALMMWIGARLTGRKWAGFLAGMLWTLHGSLLFPLGWACVFNQPLCGLCLLTAFAALLKHEETGQRRWAALEWTAFLVGFGALELNVVYPALAAAYLLLAARHRLRRTLPFFAVSIAYAAVHFKLAPVTTPVYAMHFTGSMLRTLLTYWTWSVGPTFSWTPYVAPVWLIPAGVAVVSLGLLAFAARRWRASMAAALFPLAWYFIVIGPMLPVRDHITEYYVYLPLIGLCWLGGWALETAWRAGAARRAAGIALTVVFAAMAVPQTVANDIWFFGLTQRIKGLVEGVAAAHELHPGKAILLTGVDTELFWHGMRDRPFRLAGVEQVYLAPGSQRTIEARPDSVTVGDFVLPADAVMHALGREALVVYDASGPRLRAITASYAVPPGSEGAPARIDAANPLLGYLLGPEWYPVDGDHRWMPARATLRMGAPQAPGKSLYLAGVCPEGNLQAGPLPVVVSVNGIKLPEATIQPGQGQFQLVFPLPAAVTGTGEMQVEAAISRTTRAPGDDRDLGLAFGVFEVR
jgi:hypothetical protein